MHRSISKNKFFPLMAILILFSVISIVIFVLNNNFNQSSVKNLPVSYEQNPVSNPDEIHLDSRTLKTYSNKNLPGLAIQYHNSWTLKVKEFTDNDNNDFKSRYFPICNNSCMGLKFSKDEVKLNIIFDLAFDDSGRKCSNSVTYKQIDNNWIRVKDSNGYFYTKNYQINVVTKPEEPFSLGTENDEWSLLSNTNYQICVNGTGYFRDESVNVYSSPLELGTLVENPTIEGNSSQIILDELDEIIKTLD